MWLRRVEKLAVHAGLGAHAGSGVGGRIAGRGLGFEVDHQAHLPTAFGAQRLHAGAVRHHQMPGGDGGLIGVAVAGRQGAMQVAAVGDHPGFVEGGPGGDPVAQRPCHHLRKPGGKAVLGVVMAVR